MGKSAGKWIKTVLFGKKHPKSNYPKNVTPDKKNGAKTPIEDLARDSSVVSEPSQLTERGTENLELEKGISGSPCDTVAVSYVDQGVDSQSDDLLVSVGDDEMRRREEAATKAQAAFRGYLARRAFRALKGIIRLQALIRGHLVRRQAVATLRCMHAIVKFQALARGRRVRLLDAVPEVRRKFNIGEFQVAAGAHSGSFFRSEILAIHPFIRKLVFTLPNAMPLSLQYDLTEPNSASNWVKRWSTSRFWELPTRAKKVTKARPLKKQGGPQIVESEPGKSRRTIRKASTTGHGEITNSPSSEMDKPKRNPRKVATNQTDAAQEQPASELERVKRSLRKVTVGPEKPEPETKKPQPLQSMEVVTNPTLLEASEEEKMICENPEIVEAASETPKDEIVDTQNDNHPATEINALENDVVKVESGVLFDDDSGCKEEQKQKENHKIRKRRSLPAKADYPENVSQNSPSVPSYMAATASAKAKLRAQGASKFVEDGGDYGNARRLSLPASTNGKVISLSPTVQKPVQANGKGGSKVNRSLTVARDEKVLQPGWRR